MQRKLLAVVVPLAAGVVVAGCGSSDNSSSTATSAGSKVKSTAQKAKSSNAAGNSSTLSLSADPSGALKFNKKVLSTKSGAVTINMKNPASIPHAIAVEGNGVDKDGQTVSSGGTSTVSVTLKPGKYTFYCPVDSHKQQGMEGTLTVT